MTVFSNMACLKRSLAFFGSDRRENTRLCLRLNVRVQMVIMNDGGMRVRVVGCDGVDRCAL